MQRSALAAALVAVAGAVAFAGCREPTQITVELTTDVRCTDVRGTLITVGALADLDAHPLTTATTACVDGRIGNLVIVPSGEEDGIVGIKIVLGFGRDPAECLPPAYGRGCIVARRALRYIPHSHLVLPIVLSTSCDGIACGTTDTCVTGGCRSATIPDPASCEAPGGCSEVALDPPVSAGADGGTDADGKSDAPAASCTASATPTCVPALPPGWSPLAFAASRTAACAEGYGALDLVTGPTAGAGACTCGCQPSTINPPTCANGMFVGIVSSATPTVCDTTSNLTFAPTSTACTPTGASAMTTNVAQYTPLPLTPGTCVASVRSNPSTVTTAGVRACTPPPECAEQVCAGSPPPGFASCVMHDGEIPCPGAPFVTRTIVGEAASLVCSGCASCTNAATCGPVKLRYYTDAACNTEVARRVVDGTCHLLESGAAGAGFTYYRYDATLVNPTACTMTSSPTTDVALTSPRTVCCR